MRIGARFFGMYLAFASGAWALAGCVSSRQLQATSGGTVGRARGEQFEFTVSVNAWSAGRAQLRGHLIPVWVKLSNRSTESVRVTYADLGAIDDQGFWIALIDPQTGASVAGSGSTPAKESPTSSNLERPLHEFDFEGDGARLLAELIPVWRDVTEAPTFVRNGGGSARPVRGGYVAPAFGNPRYAYPWGYSSYYWGWGWPYYGRGYYGPQDYYYYDVPPTVSQALTTETMVNVGLAEGELRPGASTAGFVYFPGSLRRANPLDIAWDVHSARGTSLTELRARFVWVEP